MHECIYFFTLKKYITLSGPGEIGGAIMGVNIYHDED